MGIHLEQIYNTVQKPALILETILLVDQSTPQIWHQIAPVQNVCRWALECEYQQGDCGVAQGVSVMLIIMSSTLLLDCDQHWKESDNPGAANKASDLIYCRWLRQNVSDSSALSGFPILRCKPWGARANLPHQWWLMRFGRFSLKLTL